MSDKANYLTLISEHTKSTDPSFCSDTNTTIIPRFDLSPSQSKSQINKQVDEKNHGFKNRTGPAGPTGLTGNRPSIRSGYDKKPKIY